MMDADLAAFTQQQAETFPNAYPEAVHFRFTSLSLLDEVVGRASGRRCSCCSARSPSSCSSPAPTSPNLLLAARGDSAARSRPSAPRSAPAASGGAPAPDREPLFGAHQRRPRPAHRRLGALDALLALSPAAVPRLKEAVLDGRVLMFTLAVSLGTGLVFGMAPALTASRADLNDALKNGMHGATASRGHLRHALVVAEVALSLVLLVGTGLMVRSFVGLLKVDPGFRPEQALMLRISRPVSGATASGVDGDQFVSFFEQATTRLNELPGVIAVGGSNILPLDTKRADRIFDIEGFTAPTIAEAPSANMRQVTPGWFAAMGIPLTRGRFLADTDGATAPRRSWSTTRSRAASFPRATRWASGSASTSRSRGRASSASSATCAATVSTRRRVPRSTGRTSRCAT